MSLGIIEKTRKNNRGHKYVDRPTTTDRRQNPKLLDLQVFRDTVENVCNHHIVDDPKEEWEHNRRWSYVSEFRLGQILGYVDMPTWVFMIESTIEWCREAHESVQPNGKWTLCGFEQTLERRDSIRRRTVGQPSDTDSGVVEIAQEVQYLVIGLEFVDLNGNQDLKYDMGRVTREGDNQAQLTPQMLAKLMASGGAAPAAPAIDQAVMKEQEEKISTQQGQIDELSQKLSQMTNIMAEMMNQMQTPAAPVEASVDVEEKKPKVTRRRTKKSKVLPKI